MVRSQHQYDKEYKIQTVKPAKTKGGNRDVHT